MTLLSKTCWQLITSGNLKWMAFARLCFWDLNHCTGFSKKIYLHWKVLLLCYYQSDWFEDHTMDLWKLKNLRKPKAGFSGSWSRILFVGKSWESIFFNCVCNSFWFVLLISQGCLILQFKKPHFPWCHHDDIILAEQNMLAVSCCIHCQFALAGFLLLKLSFCNVLH